MKRSGPLKTAAVVTAATGWLAAAGLGAGVADAQERVRWKMASSYPSTLDVFGQNVTRLVDNIEAMSDGNFRIEFFEPGALVPALEVFDAVSAGSVDAAYTSSGFHAGKVPHMIFFGSVPFGPNMAEYVAWLRAGGKELYDEEYAKHGIKGLQCGVIVPESSGWFRQPVESVEDLQGIKMRFYGLGADVMQKLGVNTQLLGPADIYPALERGVIDATEFSYPSADQQLGFYQIAKHNYFPGWHQQTPLLEVIINMDRWEELPDYYKRMLEVACGEAMTWSLAEAEAKQGEALEFFKEKGVTIHQWPQEFIDAYRDAWNQVAEERAAADPNFKRIYEDYKNFRDEYAQWREVGYLKQ